MISAFVHAMRENKITAFAFVLFAVFVCVAVIGPYIAPFDPLNTSAGAPMTPPSAKHWFGTDALGRDILSRVLVATRLDLGLALAAVAASVVIGSCLGALAGYFGGWTDVLVSRFSDLIMAFPLFVLAMGIVAALGNTIGNIILATAIINLPFYIRVTRTEVNVRRELGFVEAAKLAGNGEMRTLFFHIMPNVFPPLVVQISLNMGWAILNAAGLSFIGLGVRPPEAEWGIMVAEGAQYIFSGEWWVALFPGAVLMLAVFCFNLMGDGLRDIIDPKKRT
jgi:peptide/nickel transport system permease protein